MGRRTMVVKAPRHGGYPLMTRDVTHVQCCTPNLDGVVIDVRVWTLKNATSVPIQAAFAALLARINHTSVKLKIRRKYMTRTFKTRGRLLRRLGIQKLQVYNARASVYWMVVQMWTILAYKTENGHAKSTVTTYGRLPEGNRSSAFLRKYS